MNSENSEKILLLTVTVVLFAIVALLFVLPSYLKSSNAVLSSDSEAEEEETEAPSEEEQLPVEDGLVRIAYNEGLGNMDVAKNSSNYYLALNLFDRLVDVEVTGDGSTEIVPSLAEEWSVSDDGKTYSFTLRNGVLFSDGTPLTAEDVRFSLTRLLSEPESVQTANADMIEGAGAVLNGETDELTGIHVKDDTHIDINLSEPFPSFLGLLASPACSVLSKKAVTAAGGSYGTKVENIIGTGPYMITQEDEDSCILEVNPNYWGETPSVKKAELRIMVSSMINREFGRGNLDLLDMSMLNIVYWSDYLSRNEYRDRMVKKDKVEIVSLFMNNVMPPFDKKNIRKAVQMAIDRERILKEVCSGYATLTDGIFPKGLIGYSEENQGWLEYDPEKAKKIIKESGIGKDYTIELSYGASADSSVQKLNEIVQENLMAVGLNAVIVVYDDESRMYLRRNGKLMAGVFNWTADYNDPDNFIYSFFGTDEATKRFSNNYSNPSVKARIAKARTIADDEERLKEYAALERKLVIDDAVWVPLYSSQRIFIKGERVESYTPYWAGWSGIILKNLKLK